MPRRRKSLFFAQNVEIRVEIEAKLTKWRHKISSRL